MTKKSALYALAVLVLTGSMVVAALADEAEANMYGPADSSVSAEPEQGADQPGTGEIREPMETGSVPERSERPSDMSKDGFGDEPTEEIAGRTFRAIDLGP